MKSFSSTPPILYRLLLLDAFLLFCNNISSFSKAFTITTKESSHHNRVSCLTQQFRNPRNVFLVTSLSSSSTATDYATSKGGAGTSSTTSASSWWKDKDRSLLHNVYHKDKLPSLHGSDEHVADYIIIGSGIGGLWLGACLAKFNISCVVLEQHYIAGGFQHTFWAGKGINRYEFVPGLHYIANLDLCAPLFDMVATPSAMLKNHNVNISDTTTSFYPNVTQTKAGVRYHKAGNSVPADLGQNVSHELKIGNLPLMQVQEGKDNVRKELIRVFPNESQAVDNFLNLMEKAKWQAGQFATFKIFPKWLQFITSQFLCSSYIKYASQTTEEVLDKLTNDGRLKTVLSAFGGDLGESIGEGSFVMQAAVLGHVIEGCYYPEGGPIQFARGLIPTIRQAGGDVFVKARVEKILVDDDGNHQNNNHGDKSQTSTKLVRRVGLANGDIISSRLGIVSDCGFRSTLKLLPSHEVHKNKGGLQILEDAVAKSSGGISHVFTFVGLNASFEELGLKSSSFYYIPWNTTDKTMDATEIQDYYRKTLLDPNVLDVSAGIVFASAKDPTYASVSIPNRSTAIIFSEATDKDFLRFVPSNNATSPGASSGSFLHGKRTQDYQEAKDLIQRKMIRSLLLNYPHLESFIDVVEVGTPLTLFDYTRRYETLGLRHTPRRMVDLNLRPDCELPGLYFTGQDVAFAGWAGALAGAMVTAQRLLGYTLWDFINKKTLLRDLGNGELEDSLQQRVQEGTAATPFDVLLEVIGNAIRHIRDPPR